MHPEDLTPVTCLPLSLCMEYDGVETDDVVVIQPDYLYITVCTKCFQLNILIDDADFNVQYILDSKITKDPRMFFLNHEGRNILNETIRLNKRKQQCTTQQVYLRVKTLNHGKYKYLVGNGLRKIYF